MTTVLVTGATGLLGSSTTIRLLEMGHRVVGYDLVPNLANLGPAAGEVEVITGDVAELSKLLNVMKRSRAERVIHLAGAVGGSRDPLGMVMTNVIGTANVFNAVLALDIERVCWASSAGVYGRRSQYQPGVLLTEDMLLSPFTVYRASKVTCEAMATEYRASGLKAIGIRPVMTFGIGRLEGAGTGELNAAVRDVTQGRPAVFPATLGRLVDKWQPMFNKDIAAVFIAGIFVDETEHWIFNPPLREIVTVQETIELLRELVPGADITFGVENPTQTISDLPLLDGSRAERELGITPQYDLRAAFAEMIDHYSR